MADGSCELDLIENRFWVDRPNLQALAGPLEDLSNQVSGISVNAQGKGAVWQVPWSKRDLDRSMLMVSMEGRCELTRGKHVKYAFLMTRDLSLHHQSRLLVSIKAPQKVRVAVKAAAQDDIIECDRLYITPFRPISNRLPIEITVSAPAGSKVFGANAAGEVFVEVAATFNAATSQLSFVTPNRQDIAFYTVERASSAAK
jgi:hypothetical protein